MLQVLLPEAEIKAISQNIPANEVPVWYYWEEFVQKHLRTGKSETTVKNVRDALRLIIRRLDIFTIQQFNNPRLVEDALFSYMEENSIKHNTFNSYRKNLNTYGIWLGKMDYIDRNNIPKIAKCKAEYDENLTSTQEQVNAVVVRIRERKQTKLERLRNTFFIDLLRFTGARPCEFEDLKLKDIIKEGKGYKLCLQGRKQKGRKRYYPLCSYVIDSFEAYMDFRSIYRPNEDYLFVSAYKRVPWTYVGIKNLFASLSKELGFRVNSYSFRRYVATKLNSLDMPIENIRDYLGHTRVATTLRYIERSCVLTKDCAKVMGV